MRENLSLVPPAIEKFSDISFEERAKFLRVARDEFNKKNKSDTSDIAVEADNVWARGLTVGERAFWNDFFDNYRNLPAMEKSVLAQLQVLSVQLARGMSKMETDGALYEKNILEQELAVLRQEAAHVAKPRAETPPVTPVLVSVPAEPAEPVVPTEPVKIENKGKLNTKELKECVAQMNREQLMEALTDFSWDPPLVEQCLLLRDSAFDMSKIGASSEGDIYDLLARRPEFRFEKVTVDPEFKKMFDAAVITVKKTAKKIYEAGGKTVPAEDGWVRCGIGDYSEKREPVTEKTYFTLDYVAMSVPGASPSFEECANSFFEELAAEPDFIGQVKFSERSQSFVKRRDNMIVHHHPPAGENFTDEDLATQRELVKGIAERCFGKYITATEYGADSNVVDNLKLMNRYLKKIGIEMVDEGSSDAAISKVSYKLLDARLSPEILKKLPTSFSSEERSYTVLLSKIVCIMGRAESTKKKYKKAA